MDNCYSHHCLDWCIHIIMNTSMFQLSFFMLYVINMELSWGVILTEYYNAHFTPATFCLAYLKPTLLFSLQFNSSWVIISSPLPLKGAASNKYHACCPPIWQKVKIPTLWHLTTKLSSWGRFSGNCCSVFLNSYFLPPEKGKGKHHLIIE